MNTDYILRLERGQNEQKECYDKIKKLKDVCMKKYLSDIFGVNVKIENWDGKLQLPLYLRNKREYYMLSLGER